MMLCRPWKYSQEEGPGGRRIADDDDVIQVCWGPVADHQTDHGAGACFSPMRDIAT